MKPALPGDILKEFLRLRFSSRQFAFCGAVRLYVNNKSSLPEQLSTCCSCSLKQSTSVTFTCTIMVALILSSFFLHKSSNNHPSTRQHSPFADKNNFYTIKLQNVLSISKNKTKNNSLPVGTFNDRLLLLPCGNKSIDDTPPLYICFLKQYYSSLIVNFFNKPTLLFIY
jgi:hypothetical protein